MANPLVTGYGPDKKRKPKTAKSKEKKVNYRYVPEAGRSDLNSHKIFQTQNMSPGLMINLLKLHFLITTYLKSLIMMRIIIW